MTETKVTCPLCWFDIPFDDEARARTFYNEVFGFEWESMGKEMPYFGLKGSYAPQPEAGNMGGGMLPRMHPEHGPLLYFKVPSLEEWHGKIEQHGGQVIQPNVQVGEMGSFSICLDSEGNGIAIWQGA
jgi:uncharacterized protein